jgi:hypothetical protein
LEVAVRWTVPQHLAETPFPGDDNRPTERGIVLNPSAISRPVRERDNVYLINDGSPPTEAPLGVVFAGDDE